MTTVLIFIAVLALLIFVHELGHYLTAVRNGVTAHEFGFGFPPRIVGVVKDDDGAWKIIGRTQKKSYRNTIFSLNWIPLGGFVRIKGEDGADKDPDSFASQSAWVRFKILVAGVVMNVIAAYVLFAVALSLGMPEAVPDGTPGSRVQITQVEDGAPADVMGVRIGDVPTKVCAANACVAVRTTQDFVEFARAHAGEDVRLHVLRRGDAVVLTGRLREDTTQGAFGVGVMTTARADLSFLEVIGAAAAQTWEFLVMIVGGLAMIIVKVFTGAGAGADVAGPVGIAVMTGQMAALGMAQLAHFAALLSLNLAVINILPIPALDGGRILFLAIEKLRGGRPINRRTEAIIHSVSFMALIVLMIVVTVRDVMKIF